MRDKLTRARERAAQAWCTPETRKLTMIPELAEAFARILDEVWSQPWLGNATTRELLEELTVRVSITREGLDYRLDPDRISVEVD